MNNEVPTSFYRHTPSVFKKYKKYNPGSPNIDNVIENVIVFLYFWKYKTWKQKYIVSGFEFRVLYFWKYKSTIKYKFHPDNMHPKSEMYISLLWWMHMPHDFI